MFTEDQLHEATKYTGPYTIIQPTREQFDQLQAIDMLLQHYIGGPYNPKSVRLNWFETLWIKSHVTYPGGSYENIYCLFKLGDKILVSGVQTWGIPPLGIMIDLALGF